MNRNCKSINLDAISPPCSRFDQWLVDVGDGKTTLAFEEWLVQRLAASDETEGMSISSMLFHQGPVEFDLVHGASYMAEHPQKGVRHFRCILDGHFPMISFYRPGTPFRFPWVTMARVFIADELRSLKRVA